MSAVNKNVIITKKARVKLAKARAGVSPLSKIVGMAFGDGGVDSGGTVISPETDQVALKNELMRKRVDKFTFPVETTCRYECTLLESELIGKEISEIGLYDEDGDLVCIKTFKKKGKDDDIEQTYVIDDVF